MDSQLHREFYDEPCQICGGPVVILFKRDRAQNFWLKWVPQRVWCDAGCNIRDAEMRIRRHIALRERLMPFEV
jgi:hypothetical protein